MLSLPEDGRFAGATCRHGKGCCSETLASSRRGEIQLVCLIDFSFVIRIVLAQSVGFHGAMLRKLIQDQVDLVPSALEHHFPPLSPTLRYLRQCGQPTQQLPPKPTQQPTSHALTVCMHLFDLHQVVAMPMLAPRWCRITRSLLFPLNGGLVLRPGRPRRGLHGAFALPGTGGAQLELAHSAATAGVGCGHRAGCGTFAGAFWHR